eukprot:CAMPEP_0194530352 /NCGR_PEP_ID=MMETSP0253-20130528/67272_1 /TAXON_ID=2966 /ORGANISM="Noctiluca scintillans" /LENGTH=50 /DNA_ID=CAMNT_0039375575 /DNA_START=15 /DNA_END=164 /DNA_ORIENTATION=+
MHIRHVTLQFAQPLAFSRAGQPPTHSVNLAPKLRRSFSFDIQGRKPSREF